MSYCEFPASRHETDIPYRNRLKKCIRLMQSAGLDALLLTKLANMFYLTGDGRLCT